MNAQKPTAEERQQAMLAALEAAGDAGLSASDLKAANPVSPSMYHRDQCALIDGGVIWFDGPRHARTYYAAHLAGVEDRPPSTGAKNFPCTYPDLDGVPRDHEGGRSEAPAVPARGHGA